MKKLFKVLIFTVTLLTVCRICDMRTCAQDLSVMEQLNELDFSEINSAIDRTVDLPEGDSFTEIAVKVIAGEMNLSLGEIVKSLLASLFSEVGVFMTLIRDMTIVAILSALLNVISNGLRNKSVANLGFYVVYVIITTLLLDSFAECIGVMRDFAGNICQFVEASIPLMASLMLMSGNPAAAAVFNPLAIFAAGTVELIIRDIAAPILIFVAALEIVNNITVQGLLDRFCENLRKLLSMGLKILAGLFVGVLTLQRMSVPIADGATVKAVKFAVTAVPVVGQALTGAVDAVMYWSGAVKNGVMIAIIITIIFLCLPAIIKTAAFVVIYKLTAALIEPICDKRAVNAVNAAGTLAGLALGACALSTMAFIFFAIIIISI